MLHGGKKNVLGVLIDAIDYEGTVEAIFKATREGRGMAVSALAVHGLMTGVLDQEQKYRLNQFDLLVPDGQPVRWALNLLHKARLKDRVYGPNLMLAICARAASQGVLIYCYGSTPDILKGLEQNLLRQFPQLRIAGMSPSKFRRLTPEEKGEVVHQLRQSRASIVLVGLGSPRQEVWAFEFRNALSLPTVAVGAAFPFLAGVVPQAPVWMQDAGLEWLFRLGTEPRRLWRRYVFLNPAYLLLLGAQLTGLLKFEAHGKEPKSEMLYG